MSTTLLPHTCRVSQTCICSISALEPHDNCPIHGSGWWPPRCEECGRFLPWDNGRSPTKRGQMGTSCPDTATGEPPTC